MRIVMAEWIILPFVIWGVFQGVLYYHAAQVDMALKDAIFESQIQAAVEGRVTEEIKENIRDYLVTVHNYDREKIEIIATENLTFRPNYIDIEVRVPRPNVNVLTMFKNDGPNEYVEKRRIMSEYNGEPGV